MFTMDEIISFIVVALAVGGIIVLQWFGKKITEGIAKQVPLDPGEPAGSLDSLEINPRTLDRLERVMDVNKGQFERYMEEGKWKFKRTYEDIAGNAYLFDCIGGIKGETGDENTPTVNISRCPYCRRKVEEDKGSCPGCGAPY